jgi:hypothetical protein
MTDADRFKLLFGPYRTPRFRYGGTLRCELRGDLVVTGLTDAPVPWPLGKRRGGPRKAPGAAQRAAAGEGATSQPPGKKGAATGRRRKRKGKRE